jgi:hypothetical protein
MRSHNQTKRVLREVEGLTLIHFNTKRDAIRVEARKKLWKVPQLTEEERLQRVIGSLGRFDSSAR